MINRLLCRLFGHKWKFQRDGWPEICTRCLEMRGKWWWEEV